ncbi:MAG TPA: DMT family transporter [Pelagibacteraceae bacterium]|nr:DMT family transporter [Pelagibacteraceae bacterium]
MLSKEKTAYIFLILTTLFWSGNFIVGKAASLFEIPPFTLNFYRWLFAWLILAPFTLKEILKKKNYILENIKLILILGITSITIFNSIVYYSLNFTQVISGVLMISTIPVMIIFFCWIFKIEKTNIYQITGVIFSLLGVVVIITKADLRIILNLNFNKGDLWMAVAMFSWAIYSALLRKKNFKLSQLSLLQTIISAGLIILLPAYLIEFAMGYRVNIHLPFILTLTYVVFFPGLASFTLWIKGISIIGSNRSGIFLHLMPIFSTILAMLIFNEKFMAYHLIGAIFIVTGIVLSSKKTKHG